MLALLLLSTGSMYLGLYQGSAAMTGLERWQALISQNLANSSVSGYKAASVSMQGKSVGPDESFGNVLRNTMLSAQPTPDFGQGQLVPTDNPLDVAVDGEGFFEIETADGGQVYTRDGQFRLNAENVLVNKANEVVLGTGGEIQLVPGNGPVRIDNEGRVFQGANQVGELSLVDLRNKRALEPVSGGFRIKLGEDAQPRAVEHPRLLQGYYEGSNVLPVREMVNLIAVTRGYEANEKVIQAHDRQMDRVISTFAV